MCRPLERVTTKSKYCKADLAFYLRGLNKHPLLLYFRRETPHFPPTLKED